MVCQLILSIIDIHIYYFSVEIFVRTDPSGRLPYSSLPNILQRFGIALTENDLTSAAKSLDYNSIINLSFSF
jgi:Ca2+-binding EF-hand superfamily protein